MTMIKMKNVKRRGEIPVKEYFTIVSESLPKINKVIILLNNIFAKMETLCSDYVMTTQHLVTPQIVSYNLYEYITEKQYKDILDELTNEGLYDFSFNGITSTIVESEELMSVVKAKAKHICTSVKVPVLLYSLPICDDDDVMKQYHSLYKHYEYIKDVILVNVLDFGIKMDKYQMTQLNAINKFVKNKKSIVVTATQNSKR